MIKKIANEFVNNYKNNPIFKKSIIYYILTGCIIFFLFGIVTIFGISSASTSQLNETEQKMLEQSCNTANIILRDIHSICNNKYYDEPALLEALTTPYSSVASQNVQSIFSQTMACSSLIDSLYAINLKDDVIYSTQTNAKNVSDFFDDNILIYLEENPAKTDLFFSRSVDLTFDVVNTEHIDYITSVYRNSKDYAFVVNINQNIFQQMVNMTSGNPSYETVVMDSDGYIIAHSNPMYFAYNMSDEQPYKQILSSSKSVGSFKYKGAAVNFVRSNNIGFLYISISDAVNPLDHFMSLLIYLLLFTLLLLLMYIICGTFESLRSFVQINNLKKNIYMIFNKDYSEEVPESEIDNISKLLNEVKNQYNSIETIRHKYINEKQNSTLKKLLTGIYAYIQDDLNSCDITFPYNGFAVLVMHIDNVSKMDSDTIFMIKYAIMNIGTEIFESHSYAYATEIGEYDIEFVLNYMTYGFIEESIKKLNIYLKKFLDATVSVAYDCAISASLDDISILYHNAKYALNYKIVFGHESIIAYDNIKQYDRIIPSYPEELEKDIIKSITTQDKEVMTQKIDDFIKFLQNISFNMIILYCDRLRLAIEQFAIRSNMTDDSNDSPQIMLNFIAGIETMDEVKLHFINRCNNLMLKFSNIKLDSKKDIMVKTVLDYIENNYTDPNLSIDMIANEINRSANYTRNIFKQSKGISISDYIAKKRFDEFCRLLRETNLTAMEIGSKIGFNASGSYFYTAFKKHTGYTPDQYRKLYHNK